MKDILFDFQSDALEELRDYSAVAHFTHSKTHKPQIIAFSSPTGSGKTNVMISFIEETLNSTDGKYPSEPDSIFIWLSDSPELNEQTRLKFEAKSDRIPVSALVTVDSSFDAESFDPGKVYFLNTQKLGKDKLLTKTSDARQYSLWETVQNTVDVYPEKVYLIIDEAHRGTQNARDVQIAASIMQKFIVGSPDDGLEPMPLVIGVSATPQRFINLVGNTATGTIHTVTVDPEAVRASGLLKDHIIIRYPDLSFTPDMAMLQAAADDWKDKCDRWEAYAKYSGSQVIHPVLIVQVLDGDKSVSTKTDLGECLKAIEERVGSKFMDREVGHTFNDYGPITANGTTIYPIEPSRIQEEEELKVVFFKMNLSTGWDCPRAEAMMSFRAARDATYIAQLLGRMIRTPLAKRIPSDEELNNVKLFLPHFDEDTVEDVVKALKDCEGSQLATDITTTTKTTTLTVRPQTPSVPQGSQNTPNKPVSETNGHTKEDTPAKPQSSDNEQNKPSVPYIPTPGQNAGETRSSVSFVTPEPTKWVSDTPKPPVSNPVPVTPVAPSPGPIATPAKPVAPVHATPASATSVPSIDRQKIIDSINNAGLDTYIVIKTRPQKASRSLFRLADLLVNKGINMDARDDAVDVLVEDIHDVIDALQADGSYNGLVTKITNFKLESLVFDAFGEVKENASVTNVLVATNYDVDRQYELALGQLSTRDIGQEYLRRYADPDDIDSAKIDVIIYVTHPGQMDKYEVKCKQMFDDLCDKSRIAVAKAPEDVRSRYNSIVGVASTVNPCIYQIPETIDFPVCSDGKAYPTHLFTNNDGSPAMISMNPWESEVVEEESQRKDFVSWIRFIDRKNWAICIPYKKDGVATSSYPDLMIIRKDGFDYVFDILEPHDPSRNDNLGKAIGFAEYAENNKNTAIGRLQIIRQVTGPDGKKHYCRLDLMKHSVRAKVIKATSNDQLNAIFDSDGFYDR